VMIWKNYSLPWARCFAEMYNRQRGLK